IATIDLTVIAQNDTCDEATLIDYWRYFVNHLEHMLPTEIERLKEIKEISNKTLTFYVKTDAERAILDKKLTPSFKKFCKRAGLPTYQLQFDVRTNQNEIENFRQQTSEEDKK